VEVENLKQLNENKEKQIAQLEGEVSRCETRSEVMSNYTASRTEDISRMKDVEDSLEERYNKLKMLAVKMKKKIGEQNEQIKDMDTKLAKEKNNKVPANIQVTLNVASMITLCADFSVEYQSSAGFPEGY